ncbi:MAG: hypothetical protein KGP28_07725 [Bdellovibrionales bacterium]|nr:hypothetical protein [Bdellovibrionales bacterium]
MQRLGLGFVHFVIMGFLIGSSGLAQTTTDNPRAMPGLDPSGKTKVLERQELPISLNESATSDLRMPGFRNPTLDPISGIQFERVLYGPVSRSRNPLADYSLWRHVTVYSVKARRENMADLPSIHQSCFDGGKYPIGNWQISRTLSVELRSSLRCGDLGLGAEFSAAVSEGRTFSMQRALIVPEGIEADYVPLLRQEDWEGVTFIQTYEPSTGELGFIPKNILDEAFGWYPFPFVLRNAATFFEVSRQNAVTCKGSKGEVRESGRSIPDLILPME